MCVELDVSPGMALTWAKSSFGAVRPVYWNPGFEPLTLVRLEKGHFSCKTEIWSVGWSVEAAAWMAGKGTLLTQD